MTGFVVILSGVVGLVIGSFLNVVVWRVPRGESLVRPPSHCPRCEHPIRPWDNVPLVSWLVLRGRCRDCGAPIAVRYPLVELGTGLLFALTAWFTGLAWVLPALLFLGALSIALALIDIDVHRLPDSLVLPAYPVALGLLVLASANPGGTADWGALLRALAGAGAMLVAYLLMVIAYPAGMGLGDVKLAGVLGLYLGWYGWAHVLVGWFAAFLLGAAFAVVLLVARRAGRRSGIPFGPWMLLGAAVGITIGAPVADWYLGLL